MPFRFFALYSTTFGIFAEEDAPDAADLPDAPDEPDDAPDEPDDALPDEPISV